MVAGLSTVLVGDHPLWL